MHAPPRKVWIPVAAIVLVAVLYRPVRAGITSLWTDDATLVQQLVQLMKIREEMQAVSDGVMITARATQDVVHMYADITAAIDEVQQYGPEALWRDFREDLYNHYPGFRYLEGNHNLAEKWQYSRSRSPATTYEMIGAVFGDLSAPLREQERRGEIDTTDMRVQRHESAGALSQSSDALEATKAFDRDIEILLRQAEEARSGDEAAVLTAKAQVLAAAQNSHIIRLLSRSLRLDAVDEAIEYGARIRSMNRMEKTLKSSGEFAKKAIEPPSMMDFNPSATHAEMLE